MSVFKQFLALTDFSTPALHACQRAAILSSQQSGQLALLHVLNQSLIDKLQHFLQQDSQAFHSKLVTDAQQQLTATAQALQEQYGINGSTHQRQGDLLSTLNEEVVRLQADLLVCGDKGSQLLTLPLLGSTAERLVRTSPVPVLVVKRAAFFPYRRILIPVDFSPRSLSTLQQALTLAEGATPILQHVIEIPFERKLALADIHDDQLLALRKAAKAKALAQLQQLAQQAGAPPHCQFLVSFGNPALQILTQEQEQDADLIVLAKQSQSELTDLLLGSVTKYVLPQAKADVLVCH